MFPAPLTQRRSFQCHVMLDHYYKKYLCEQKEKEKPQEWHSQTTMILSLCMNEGECHHRSDIMHYTCIMYAFFLPIFSQSSLIMMEN